MSNSCKICTHHWISDRPATTTLASDLDYVIMSSCKVKKHRDADISETDLVTGFFPTIAQIIYSLHSKLLRLHCDLRLRYLRYRPKTSARHFHAFDWEPMKLSQINHVIW